MRTHDLTSDDPAPADLQSRQDAAHEVERSNDRHLLDVMACVAAAIVLSDPGHPQERREFYLLAGMMAEFAASPKPVSRLADLIEPADREKAIQRLLIVMAMAYQRGALRFDDSEISQALADGRRAAVEIRLAYDRGARS